MDKILAGGKIKKHMLTNKMKQQEIIELVNEVYPGTFKPNDGSRITRLIQGIGSDETYKKVFEALELPDPAQISTLRVGFASGFWAAPIIARMEETNKTTTIELLKKVQLTGYEMSHNKEEIFNTVGKALDPFMPEMHNFYFSGEILDKLKHGKIDIGFMGGTLAQKHEGKILRIAQVCDAASSRHAMLVVAPVGTFTSQAQAIRYLVNEPDNRDAFENKPECLVLFQDESTSELEYELLFQPANHKGEAIQILNMESYKEAFREKLLANKGKVVAQIALMLTVDAAKSVVDELKKQGHAFEYIQPFRTVEFFKLENIRKKNIWTARDFSFDMVVLRDRVHEILQHPGFFPLVEYLDASTRKLVDAQKVTGATPRVFQNVINFYGLTPQSAEERMRDTAFALMYYPDFVDILKKSVLKQI